MAFSTRNAKRQTLSAELRDWCVTGAPDESRTLVLKLSHKADVDQVTAQLAALGVEIVSAGPAVTVANIRCGSLVKASELSGVLRIEVPARFAPKPSN